MGNRFANGKKAFGYCDKCGQRYLLARMKSEVRKLKQVNNLVCPTCFDPDHPQLQLGMYPVEDPQALRNPRRDTTYFTAGLNAAGNPTAGSRDIQWGWAPVGGSSSLINTPNNLVTTTAVGTVAVVVA